jgi:hypothetical protein
VRIDYVLERAHLPGKQGTLVYGQQRKSWSGVEAGSVFARQAQAYLESYLAWKQEGKPASAAQRKSAQRPAAAAGDL